MESIQPAELAMRFQLLMKQHVDLRHAETLRVNKILHELLPRFLDARRIWAENQKASADDFNLFEVMELEGNEVNHSKLLAWLLDHRIENGTHAQGNLGFRLFLEELEHDFGDEVCKELRNYAAEPNYWVQREFSGKRARIDIEIAARHKFIIHIENKVYSTEGEDQTVREWMDLQDRAESLVIPKNARHAVYVTIDGSRPRDLHFHPVAWHRIAKVLEEFARISEPREVKLFARHYAKALRKLVVSEHDERMTGDGDI